MVVTFMRPEPAWASAFRDLPNMVGHTDRSIATILFPHNMMNNNILNATIYNLHFKYSSSGDLCGHRAQTILRLKCRIMVCMVRAAFSLHVASQMFLNRRYVQEAPYTQSTCKHVQSLIIHVYKHAVKEHTCTQAIYRNPSIPFPFIIQTANAAMHIHIEPHAPGRK